MWVPTKLGELFRLKHGFAFKSEYYRSEGELVLLTPGNFQASGGLQGRGEKEKYYDGPVPDGFILRRGDLLVVMTDLTQNAPILGSAAFIPQADRFLHNQRLGKVVERSDAVEPLFLYYLLNSGAVRAQIRATATGSTVRHTSPDRIYAVSTAVPDIFVQRKVAAVLAAYDELIENNRRRIEILEEMAQALYREWFIDFRFPGHEHVALVDSVIGPIPEGWTLGTYGSVADEVKSGVDPQSVSPDSRYVGLEHIPQRSFTLTEWGSAREVSSRKWSFEPGDILFGRLRPYFHKVAEAGFSGIASTDAIVIRSEPGWHDYALQVAFSKEFVDHAVSTSQGTDRPRAKWSDLAAFKIALPDRPTVERCTAVVRPVVDLASNLARQNENLRTSRDLLLPRLVSGELDVSELDIDTEWLAS